MICVDENFITTRNENLFKKFNHIKLFLITKLKF